MLTMVWLLLRALASLAALHTRLRATRWVCAMRSLEQPRVVADVAGAAMDEAIRTGDAES